MIKSISILFLYFIHGVYNFIEFVKLKLKISWTNNFLTRIDNCSLQSYCRAASDWWIKKYTCTTPQKKKKKKKILRPSLPSLGKYNSLRVVSFAPRLTQMKNYRYFKLLQFHKKNYVTIYLILVGLILKREASILTTLNSSFLSAT